MIKYTISLNYPGAVCAFTQSQWVGIIFLGSILFGGYEIEVLVSKFLRLDSLLTTERFIWESVGTVITVLNCVPIVVNEFLDIKICRVISSHHNMGGSRLL